MVKGDTHKSKIIKGDIVMIKSLLLSAAMLMAAGVANAGDLGTATIDITTDRRLTVEIVDVAGNENAGMAYVTVAATNHPPKRPHCKPGTFCGKPKAVTRYATIAIDASLLAPSARDEFNAGNYTAIIDDLQLRTRVYRVKRVIRNPKNRAPRFNTLLDVTVFN